MMRTSARPTGANDHERVLRNMTSFARVLLSSATLFCAFNAHAAPRTQLQRDVEGYVSAACLAGQANAALAQQGQDWAAIIINRSRADLQSFEQLSKAVKETMRRLPMAIVKGDRPVDDPGAKAEVFYCAELIDDPEMRRVIDNVQRRLRRATSSR